MRRKILCSTILLALFMLVTTKVEANLQSKPGVTPLRSILVSDFFIKSRNMEAPGESLGLNAAIDQNNGTETSSSNGIDVHMIKNTEYGAIIMLGASAYGSIPAAQASQVSPNTITENKTGWVMNQDWTNTASYLKGGSTSEVAKMIAAPQRYWNQYVGTTYKKGDATTETRNWRNAGMVNWIASNYPVFVRGISGVFTYALNAPGHTGGYYASRACVVVSSGI